MEQAQMEPVARRDRSVRGAGLAEVECQQRFESTAKGSVPTGFAYRENGIMRFCLLDRITELERGSRITAVKVLRAEEDYLKDHFPRFPVMPGVLMLEAMYQAAAWLVRSSEDFQHAGILLKEARNVKYSDFVTPGKELVVSAELLKQDDKSASLKTQGTIAGNVAVSARLVLEKFNIGDRYPSRANCDPYSRNKQMQLFQQLMQPPVDDSAGGATPAPHMPIKSQLVSSQP